MKARVKATGEILEVYESCTEDFPWTDEMGDKVWKTEELIFLETTEENFDYWTRLEHQYAGMAMQGILSNPEVDLDYKSDECMPQAVAATAYNIAHALVEKMKEKEKK